MHVCCRSAVWFIASVTIINRLNIKSIHKTVEWEMLAEPVERVVIRFIIFFFLRLYSCWPFNHVRLFLRSFSFQCIKWFPSFPIHGEPTSSDALCVCVYFWTLHILQNKHQTNSWNFDDTMWIRWMWKGNRMAYQKLTVRPDSGAPVCKFI